MEKTFTPAIPHPLGEAENLPSTGQNQAISLDTAGGRVHVEWDSETPLTPLGQLVFFANFLQAGDLFGPFCAEAPFDYTSPNAPSATDVLGSALLSILSGHWRYSHLSALRHDLVNPPLLGMSQVMSEDSVRRGFKKMSRDCSERADQWLRKHLRRTWEALLQEEWILDIDTSVKPIYGKGEGADVSYNPHKRGRPSHVYHSYFIANIRLCLDTELHAGSKHAAKHGLPGLWKLLLSLPKSAWPRMIRGDCAYGSEAVMLQCEKHGLNYLFKLRQTKNVKELIAMAERGGRWKETDAGWQAIEASLKLSGWSKKRRIVLVRRKFSPRAEKQTDKNAQKCLETSPDGQQWLALPSDLFEPDDGYQYAVLVTSLDWPIEAIAKLYRERADCENCFDELKNQWGWGGYTTGDLARCAIMARLVALIYNWWSLYARLVDDRQHHEAVTSRPALLGGVARAVKHAGQTRIRLSLHHGAGKAIQSLLEASASFLRAVNATAEQLDRGLRWSVILSWIFRRFLGGRLLAQPPPALAGFFALS